MTRGDIYLVKKPNKADPKRQRAFVVVSRQVVIESAYATVICAPVYSTDNDLGSQVSMARSRGSSSDANGTQRHGMVCARKNLVSTT